MRYQVQFIRNGETCYTQYEGCRDAGMAFARCQKDNPACPMIDCIAYSGIDGFEAKITHPYVPVQRPVAKRVKLGAYPIKKNDHNGSMPFYDEVLRPAFRKQQTPE